MITMNSFRRLLIVICAPACLALASAAPPDGGAARPNFAGTWRLNRELSDKPQEKVKEAAGKRGGMLGRVMGGRAAEDRMKNLEGLGEVLQIVHQDPELQVAGKNGASRQIFTDGRKVSRTTPKGESIETTANWRGSQLVVVTQRANGGKLTQTYSLEPGGKRMIVLTRIAGQRLEQPIELRFVYDAESGR